MFNFATIAAAVIFVVTYLIVAIGKIPVYRIDRAGAALLGGSLMVGLGILSADEAYQAISFDTLTLLLGMMIVAANLRVSGFVATLLIGLVWLWPSCFAAPRYDTVKAKQNMLVIARESGRSSKRRHLRII